MSLINQMLQELDARRSEVTGTGPYGQQIRVVPERRRIHPAWWVALALAIILSGVLAWFLLRPPVADATRSTSAQLPLKFDTGLNMASAAVQAPPVPDKTAEPAPTVSEANAPAGPPPEPAPIVVQQAASVPAMPASMEKRAAEVKRSEPVRTIFKEAATPVPELSRVVPPARALVKNTALPALPATASSATHKQVTELSPQQRAENEYRKGVLSIQQGKAVEAIGAFEQALQLDPQHVGARHALIGVLLEDKRQDDALRVAREGLALEPAQPGLAMILARLQLEKGLLHTAIETLERALPYAADRADYQAFLAALLQRDDKHKQAVEHYLQALQKAPQNGVWWMGLAISLQAERRIPEAQEAFKRAKATNTLSAELLAFVDARLSQLSH